MQGIYERFTRLCDANGVTAYAVAKSTGIATAAFSNWKAGRYEPKVNKLVRIADYFGVSLDYLVRGDAGDELEAKVPEQLPGQLELKDM